MNYWKTIKNVIEQPRAWWAVMLDSHLNLVLAVGLTLWLESWWAYPAAFAAASFVSAILGGVAGLRFFRARRRELERLRALGPIAAPQEAVLHAPDACRVCGLHPRPPWASGARLEHRCPSCGEQADVQLAFCRECDSPRVVHDDARPALN